MQMLIKFVGGPLDGAAAKITFDAEIDASYVNLPLGVGANYVLDTNAGVAQHTAKFDEDIEYINVPNLEVDDVAKNFLKRRNE